MSLPHRKQPSFRPESLFPVGRKMGLRVQIGFVLFFSLTLSLVMVAGAAVPLLERNEIEETRLNAHGKAKMIVAAFSEVADETGSEQSSRARWIASQFCSLDLVKTVEIFVETKSVFRCVSSNSTRNSVQQSVRQGAATATVSLYTQRGLVRRWLLPYAISTVVFVLLVSYIVLTFRIVRPLENLTWAAGRFKRGHHNFLADVRGAAEVARLAEVYNEMATDLESERAALKARLEELEHANKALASARQDLVRSEKLASVGRLSAGIAHEIGNPLAAILGLIEILQEGGIDRQEHDEFLYRIKKETERIHRIIRDLLDFSRKEEDDPEKLANVPIAIREAIALIRSHKGFRAVHVETRIAASLPEVRGSTERLQQVILNLLFNASEALNGVGRIIIEASVDTSDAGEQEISIRVSDNGPGIAEQVRDQLFDPFVTTKPVGQGTGLGLSVSHSIIESMGGSITVNNLESGGACFHIRLPAAGDIGA